MEILERIPYYKNKIKIYTNRRDQSIDKKKWLKYDSLIKKMEYLLSDYLYHKYE